MAWRQSLEHLVCRAQTLYQNSYNKTHTGRVCVRVCIYMLKSLSNPTSTAESDGELCVFATKCCNPQTAAQPPLSTDAMVFTLLDPEVEISRTRKRGKRPPFTIDNSGRRAYHEQRKLTNS